jgi:hypothetical protein
MACQWEYVKLLMDVIYLPHPLGPPPPNVIGVSQEGDILIGGFAPSVYTLPYFGGGVIFTGKAEMIRGRVGGKKNLGGRVGGKRYL